MAIDSYENLGKSGNDMQIDLEKLSDFFADGLKVVAALGASGNTPTVSDYARIYEQINGMAPHNIYIAGLLNRIYRPEWKQQTLFSAEEFDEVILARIPKNMYRGEHGLFDNDPE